MTHLPEPFHSAVPLLDPTRGVTPPERLHAMVLAAVADLPDVDGPPAPRPSRRRAVLALVAACVVMLAAAGLVARLHPATTPATPAGGYPGIEDRTPPGAAVPPLTGCAEGYLLGSYTPAKGAPEHGSPQSLLLRYEDERAALLSARGVAYKWVQVQGSDLRARYFDAQGRPLQEVIATNRTVRGRWVPVRLQECVTTR